MQYMGGKTRISKQISEVINNALYGWEFQNIQINGRNYQSLPKLGGGFVSLFCGACAVEAKVKADVKILNDIHPYLIAMWKGLQNGWEPPSMIIFILKNIKKKIRPYLGLLDLDVHLAENGLAGWRATKEAIIFVLMLVILLCAISIASKMLHSSIWTIEKFPFLMGL